MTTSQAVTTGGASAGRRPTGLRIVQEQPDDGTARRTEQLEEFKLTLRATTNSRGKPYDEKTIMAYRDAVIAFSKWLTENGFEGGFEDITVLHYNTFMNAYLTTHSIGGTVTKQGNLRMFLRHIAEEYEVENIWDHKKRNSYSRPDSAPPVLTGTIIEDMLTVTGGGRAKDWMDKRDHAIIRLLLSGPRRTQIASLDVEDLDLVSPGKTALLCSLKGGRAHRIGLGHKDVLAVQRWLRVRAQHPSIGRARDKGPDGGEALFIGLKTGRRLEPGGVYQILRRRAVEAGYDKSVVYTHLFRHTAAHEFLDGGGTDTNAMAHFGWKDRSMLDRYGASQAEARAIRAVASSGFADRH